MRIGIVSNDTRQAAALVEELSGHVLWTAGAIEASVFDCPVYQDYSEALAEQAVDLIIDCAGDVQVLEAMVVPLAAALFLLNTGSAKADTSSHCAALTASASQLSSGIDKITSQISLLDNYARQLTEIGGKLDSASRGILEDLDRTGRILDSITRIAKRSKIIGLNSAIEAARVGEQGRGFAVVAEEIKNLADDSSQSVQDIEKILEGIHRRSDDFAQRTGNVNQVSDLQQQTTRQISAMLQALKELGQHLQKLAQEQTA